MNQQNTFLLIMIIILIGCTSGNIKDDNPKNEKDNACAKADIIPFDENYVSKIRSIKESSNQDEEKFIDELLTVITNFKQIPADTTIISLANIDLLNPIDTITNRIFVKNDTVHLISSWKRDGIMLWKSKVMDPYLWISNNDDFDFVINNQWATFTIAINYSIPEFYRRDGFSQISNKTAILIAKNYMENKQIDTAGISDYLVNYSGQLMEYGDPESREGLFIWHEPSRNFVLFYKP